MIHWCLFIVRVVITHSVLIQVSTHFCTMCTVNMGKKGCYESISFLFISIHHFTLRTAVYVLLWTSPVLILWYLSFLQSALVINLLCRDVQCIGFFKITVGAGGLSSRLIDIWYFSLLHGGAIQAEEGKITGYSCWGHQVASEDREESPLNLSTGGSVTV